jgi:hypothetical protein
LPEFKPPVSLPADRTGRHATRWIARRYRLPWRRAELIAGLVDAMTGDTA